ncbi:KpsF/GutQ family sugar-phosphate isomerase [Gammaproteobacteria bacterium]|nr:KpsF/GutQ family sugar-phosphate isomerase [Gammaproteobacteria bacterium]
MHQAHKILKSALSVIKIESEMIQDLKTRIDQSFVKACEILLLCKGKVIVMGMGKSGHIARKIAATLASTGTPSFFIHPGEAKHGDFGMITKQDTLIALSNSGSTEEILSILPFVKRLGISMISMTGNPKSNLAQNSTVNIDVSINKEACPLGLAPTSSTTAALVMGDAIAIALLESRGFTAKDFAKSHPGGLLGKKLLLTSNEIMHTENNIPTVSFNAILKRALVEITEKKLGMTLVLNDDESLAGIFTDGDLRRALDNNTDINKTPINELMTKNPKTIKSDMLVYDASKLMGQTKISSLVVTDENNKPIGIVHLHDILRTGIL